MIKGLVIGGIIWAVGTLFAWTLCKAAGDADDRLGTRDE